MLTTGLRALGGTLTGRAAVIHRRVLHSVDARNAMDDRVPGGNSGGARRVRQ